MATVLDRLEQLVREVISALRENSTLLGSVQSTLVRVENLLSQVEAEKSRANDVADRANDIAEENTQSVVESRNAWREALKVVIAWTHTRTAAVLATAIANVLLAWLAYWSGMPLPFLPKEEPAHVHPSIPASDNIETPGG